MVSISFSTKRSLLERRLSFWDVMRSRDSLHNFH